MNTDFLNDRSALSNPTTQRRVPCIVRVDFIATNPNRSQANAIFIALVEGPIIGVLFVFFVGSLCIVMAAVTAKATNCLFGKVPLWMLPVNGLICGAAIYVQIRWGLFQPLPVLVEDSPQMPGGFYPLLVAGEYVYILITLTVAWWLTRPAHPKDRE